MCSLKGLEYITDGRIGIEKYDNPLGIYWESINIDCYSDRH